MADIGFVRFGRRLSHHTVKRIVAEGPLPPVARRRFPPYHEIAEPAERRLAVIRLHAEGWRVTTIAAYLDVGRNRPRHGIGVHILVASLADALAA